MVTGGKIEMCSVHSTFNQDVKILKKKYIKLNFTEKSQSMGNYSEDNRYNNKK